MTLCGFMMHVTADPSNGKTANRWGKATLKSTRAKIFLLGQLNIFDGQAPLRWICYFGSIGAETYSRLVDDNENKEIWSSKLNCQIFVQKLINHFNFIYPSNILTCSDLLPTIVDLSVLSIGLSTRSKQKIRTTFKSNDDDDSDL